MSERQRANRGSNHAVASVSWASVGGVGMRLASAQGKWLLAAMILGSGMAFLDGSIVSSRCPPSPGTSAADRRAAVDRQRVHAHARSPDPGRQDRSVTGWAGARCSSSASVVRRASVMCAVAPTIEMLVAARGLQGIGAALLTPGSLAIISASFDLGPWSGDRHLVRAGRR